MKGSEVVKGGEGRREGERAIYLLSHAEIHLRAFPGEERLHNRESTAREGGDGA